MTKEQRNRVAYNRARRKALQEAGNDRGEVHYWWIRWSYKGPVESGENGAIHDEVCSFFRDEVYSFFRASCVRRLRLKKN